MAGDPGPGDPGAAGARATDPEAQDPDARRRQRLVIWVGGVVLILALAALPLLRGNGGAEVGEPAALPTDETPPPTDPTAPEPTATEPDTRAPTPTDAPPTPDTTGTPAATATPEPPSPPPTPDPMTAVALDGTASATGPTGDVVDPAGEPASAADLVEVQLSGDGEELTVEWTVAEAVPETADSLLWSVDLWTGDELAASITVQLVGARLVAGVLDWSTNEQVTPPDDPRIEGPTITLTVPLGLLPPLEAPVTWQALAQQDGGLEDRIPEDGRTPFDG